MRSTFRSGHRAWAAAAAAVFLSALTATGCSKKLKTQLVPNQPPEVRLTGAPIQSGPGNPDFYAYDLQWTGFDPDGRVDHYLFSIDPKDPYKPDPADTSWHATSRNERIFFFSAGTPVLDPATGKPDPRNPISQTFHVFAIYAVDNEGMFSVRGAVRAFYSYTQAPAVQITDPQPNISFYPTLTPTATIHWSGFDPDGQFTNKPVRWKFRLFTQRNPDYPGIPDFVSFGISYPDSLRKLYSPESANPATRNWGGNPPWNTVGGDTTSFQYRNLNPGSLYLFVVTGFDEAGAYDPIFSPQRNMLQFSVSFAGTFGPVIRMFNQFFFYQYPFGGFDTREARWFRLEIPSDLPVTFNWDATAPQGAEMRRFRWVMDLVDLSDETPRSNELTDLVHWSSWNLHLTSTTIGPFPSDPSLPPDPNPHLFYIEAEDTNGLVSLGIIYFRAVRSDFIKDLLFVKDTRYRTDQKDPRDPTLVQAPVGPWPTAAELDTFLYAVGGKPWNSYPGYRTPGATLSRPGILNGYSYDTVGTRGISASGIVPLSLLGHYKHVVWYTDPAGASYTQSSSSFDQPITALRLVSSPGRPVVLATYLTQGGSLWLCGGGAAYATLITWNARGTGTTVYTARDGELIPGRMMYDFVHWREGVQTGSAYMLRKFGAYGYTDLGFPDPRQPSVGALPGSAGWPRPPGRNWPPNPDNPLGQPDYSGLATSLHLKSGFGEVPPDLPPPLRNADSYWYQNLFTVEFIHLPTFIREDYNDDPNVVNDVSTLDTLYLTPLAGNGNNRPQSPCMTYYHGRDNKSVIFSGFDIWHFKRDELIPLVDMVLQQIWGLPRDPSASRDVVGPGSARRAAP